MSDFSRHHALVTGGGSGIGLSIAKALAGQGAKLSLTGRSEDKLKKAIKKVPGSKYAVMDVSLEQSVQAGIEQLTSQFGPVSILVNNAGAADSVPFEKTDTDFWQRMLDVNLNGAFYCTRAVVFAMKELPSARIINIASTAGLKGYAYTAAYVAAKHGVVGMTRALAVELAKTNITVNAICPGFTNTAMVEKAVQDVAKKSGKTEAEILKGIKSFNPQGRLVEPEEVAAVVLWLASDSARSITGQAIAIAGGEVM